VQYSTVQVLELGFYHICAVVALLIFHFPHVIFILNHRCFLDVYSQKDKELYSEQCEITNQINQLNDYEKDTKKFIDYGLHLLNNLGSFFSKASVSSK
jgi:hypothetical protein